MPDNHEADSFEALLADYLERVDRGESVDRQALLRAHPRHADELRAYFENEGIWRPSQAGQETATFTGDRTPWNRLQIRCPHCSTPNSVAVDTPLEHVVCESCGSHFGLAGDSSQTQRASTMTSVAHFELIERIGVGGFGSVWKARDTELDRAVAVKIPRQGQMTDAETEKFLREARAAAQLRHPNIVGVHEVGREGETVYIVSDLVRGITLDDWLSGQQPTAREAAELCVKIAEALHHAHEKGVIHRDLKPGNIMIDGEGEPHLMDFGLARREVGEVTVTVDGQVLGTPAYMSPEQAEGKSHEADRRTDVYSLGVVLFKLLTGELPFRGNARMLIYQVIHDEPPSPRKLNAKVPRDLETIALKCLEKEPGRRYPSASDVARDLHHWLEGRDILARPAGALTKFSKFVKRRPAIASLGAVLLLLAIGGPLVAVRLNNLRARADQARQQFEDERDTARRLLNEREQLLDRERKASYLTGMHSAYTQWNYGNTKDAIQSLKRHIPMADQVDYRRFEWRLLWALTHQEQTCFDQIVAERGELDAQVLALAPDDSVLAVGAYDNQLLFLDPKTGRQVDALTTAESKVRHAVFSPDGSQLAVVGAVVTIYDSSEKKVVNTISQESPSPYRVAYSSDGDLLAVANQGGQIAVYDSRTGKLQKNRAVHSSSVTSIAFHPNHSWLFSCSTDDTLQVWDYKADTIIGRESVGNNLWSVAVSPKGDSLTVGASGPTRSYRIDTTTDFALIKEWSLPTNNRTLNLQYTRDGKIVAAATSGGFVVIISTETGEVLERIRGPNAPVDQVETLSGGDHVVFSAFDDTVRISPIRSEVNSRLLDPVGGWKPNCVRFSHNAQMVAFVDPHGRGRLWKIGSVEAPMQFAARGQVLCFSPDDSVLAVGREDGVLQLLSTANLNEVNSYQGMEGDGAVVGLAFSPDGSQVAAGYDSGQIRLLERFENKSETVGTRYYGYRDTLCYLDDGKLLGYATGTLYCYQPLRFEENLKSLPPHFEPILVAAVSPAGSTLAASGFEGEIRLWHVHGGEFEGLRRLRASESTNFALGFSPDGSILASGEYDARLAAR